MSEPTTTTPPPLTVTLPPVRHEVAEPGAPLLPPGVEATAGSAPGWPSLRAERQAWRREARSVWLVTLDELLHDAHDTARGKGWWEEVERPAAEASPTLAQLDGAKVLGQHLPHALLLLHSELSEAVESWRRWEPALHYREDGKPEGLAAELADVQIRLFDLVGGLERSGAWEPGTFARAMREKMAFNETRPHRHGGRRA